MTQVHLSKQHSGFIRWESFEHTHTHQSVCAGAYSDVCREEGRGAQRWGGGVAAEAAGRTPASLLAPGAGLLSK